VAGISWPPVVRRGSGGRQDPVCMATSATPVSLSRLIMPPVTKPTQPWLRIQGIMIAIALVVGAPR